MGSVDFQALKPYSRPRRPRNGRPSATDPASFLRPRTSRTRVEGVEVQESERFSRIS